MQFAPEPTNDKDKEAITVKCDGILLGYVPKGLRTVMHRLLDKYIIAGQVTRLNGTPDRPCVVALVQVR